MRVEMILDWEAGYPQNVYENSHIIVYFVKDGKRQGYVAVESKSNSDLQTYWVSLPSTNNRPIKWIYVGEEGGSIGHYGDSDPIFWIEDENGWVHALNPFWVSLTVAHN